MKTRTKILLLAGAGILLLGIGIFAGWHLSRQQNSGEWKEEAKKQIKEETDMTEKQKVRVEEIGFSRISGQEIQIQWPDRWEPYVEEYQIQRRKSGEDTWQQVGTLASDQRVEDTALAWVDTLEESAVQQYEYRVDVKVADPEKYQAEEGKTVMASNLLVCIDPGHYSGKNTVESGTAYAEGDFTLQLAKELSGVLKEDYGVTSILTRDSGSISIDGYTDNALDSGHISLRGEYAEGTDLFLSIHTNANLEGANGCETEEQPISINKPILILNEIACEQEQAVKVANGIGSHLAETSYQLGIAAVGTFCAVEESGQIREWTDAYNDQTDVEGTVCRRSGEHGDYYGVLRGAANVGVPGMIIEHGFHTVPEMRQMAAAGELAGAWARADAEGIAEGFGFEKYLETKQE